MKVKPLIYIPIVYLAAIMPRIFKRPDYSSLKGYYYAHRGLHDNNSDAPENSMAAFRKAVDAGYGIELDVQLTKDRIPVIFHDDTLKRVCGVDGYVKDYTYKELLQFNLCKSHEKIPKLKEFLNFVNGRVPLIIEFKFPEKPSVVCKTADQIIQNYNGAYCIESFHPLAVRWYKTHHPEVIRGQLASNFKKASGKESPPEGLVHFLITNFLFRPDFIAYDHRYKNNISRLLCRYLFRSLSISWTIRSQKEFDACKNDYDLCIFEGFQP